jgi:hypothetical protein
MQNTNALFLETEGFCPICQQESHFRAYTSWLRDSFVCDGCGSIPRERAFFAVIEMFYPHWRDLELHETSPSSRGASPKLSTECPGYSYSYYDKNIPLGAVHPQNGYRCESVEAMTFSDERFDLFLSQDVFEHIFDPAKAIREISRVLKPGGAAIMTVPLVNKTLPTERRAILLPDGSVRHLKPPEYHGDPIDEDGALVTIDWGYDIVNYLSGSCGLPSWIVYIDDITRGIKAEYIEVVMVKKTIVPVI